MTEDRPRPARPFGLSLLLGLIGTVTVVIAINQWRLSAELQRVEKLVREYDARHQSAIYNVLDTQQKLTDAVEEARFNGVAYFPPGAFGKDDDRAAFLARPLRRLRSDSLWELADRKNAGPTVRLLWLPEDGPPTAVRLLPPDPSNSRPSLEFTQLAGAGKIVKARLGLMPEHAADLNRRLDEVGLWSAPAAAAEGARSGTRARWAIEGVKDGRYHLLVGGTADSPAFLELSKTMLGYGRMFANRGLRIP